MKNIAYFVGIALLVGVAAGAVEARAGVVDTLKKAAKEVAKAAGAGIKKAFEKAKVGVVNLAKKIKAKASEIAKFIITGGSKLYYEYAPLKYARIHKELLSPKSTATAGLVGSSAGSSS